MRVAVVDIGTNSTRLLIVDVQDGGVVAEHERHSNVTRLGEGLERNGELGEKPMRRVRSTVAEYRELIDACDVDRALAIMTSAVRDASNGREFAQGIGQHYGLEPHVLSGDEEASLTFRGATSERDPDDRSPTLVIDIGGGSTELVIGIGRDADFHTSTQAGVVRQGERHLNRDPPSEQELQALTEDVRQILAEGVPSERRGSVKHGIAVAGTATSLGAIAQELEPYDPEKVHGYLLSEEEREEILKRLAAMPLAERREVKGLHPDRAATIVAGAVILGEVIDLFGLSAVEISEHDILRGAALRWGSEGG